MRNNLQSLAVCDVTFGLKGLNDYGLTEAGVQASFGHSQGSQPIARDWAREG